LAPGVPCLRGIEADEPDVLAQSRESDCISVNDADISRRDRLSMRIGDHREKQRNSAIKASAGRAMNALSVQNPSGVRPP